MNCCTDHGECQQGHGCPARATAYNMHFDRLGTPTYLAKPDPRHRIIRAASLVTIVLCLGVLLWGR